MTPEMKNYKIIFLRKSNGHAIGCAAINLNGVLEKTYTDSNLIEVRSIQYQLSVLSPKDRFDRSLARQLALGRLLEKPFYTDVVAIEDGIHTVVETVMNDIAKNSNIPKRARQAANLWLETKLKGDR